MSSVQPSQTLLPQQQQLPPLASFEAAFRRIPVHPQSTALSALTSLIQYTSANESSTTDINYAERLKAILSFLFGLGVVNIIQVDDDLSVSYVSISAFHFTISATLCSKVGIEAISTWRDDQNPDKRLTALIRTMEMRRAEAAKKAGKEIDPVRTDTVVMVAIKSTVQRKGKSINVFLCQLDPDSGYYNFVGGKALDRTLEDTAVRKVVNELRIEEECFEVEPLFNAQPIVSQGLSNQYGVYSKYSFHLLYASRLEPRSTFDISKAHSIKWFTWEEITVGRGKNGEMIMTHAEIRTGLQDSKLAEELSKKPVSISSPNKLLVKNSVIRNWIHDAENREIVMFIVIVLGFIIAILTCVAAFLALRPQ